jgi:type IV pilus assembly protein PilW
MNSHRHSHRRGQLGLSLVELMVAMAIGTFLLAGAITVFGKTRDLYRTNDAAARLQETARYAMSTIEADLRMANYWGLMSRADLIENGPALDLANLPAVDPSYSLPAELNGYAGMINLCGTMWAVKLPAYIEATDSYTLGCAAAGAGAVAGADTLTVRRASTEQILAGAPLTNSAGQIKLQTSRVQGTLFSTATLPAGYLPPLSETRALVVNGYYIGQDSDERAGTPSLRRKQLDVDAGAPDIADRQIVPGVEDLQIELGADFNEDQNADYFVQPGTAIPAGDQIVAVRVWLLVRAEQQEQGYTDGRTYDYASRTGADVLTPADSFRRLLVSKTIALRNTRR